jgi:hypothetical protein
MSTEDRLGQLESAQAILNRIAGEQLLRLRDLEHNATILVDKAFSQEKDLKACLAEVSSIKNHLEQIEVQITMEFAGLNEQLAEIRMLLTSKPPTSPEQQ